MRLVKKRELKNSARAGTGLNEMHRVTGSQFREEYARLTGVPESKISRSIRNVHHSRNNFRLELTAHASPRSRPHMLIHPRASGSCKDALRPSNPRHLTRCDGIPEPKSKLGNLFTCTYIASSPGAHALRFALPALSSCRFTRPTASKKAARS